MSDITASARRSAAPAAIKGRPADQPLLLLIGAPDQVPALVTEVPPAGRMLMEQFWPGPLTIVFPAASTLPRELTAGTGTVGLRQPAHPALCTLLRVTGAVTGTSANQSKQAPVTTAAAVAAQLGDAVDLILDGGPTPGGPPSTLVDVSGSPRVLRDGAVARDRLAAVLRTASLDLR